MKTLFTIFTCTLLLSFSFLSSAKAATLEQQVKPYGITTEDFQTVWDGVDYTTAECQKSVISLSILSYCSHDGQQFSKYAAVSPLDAQRWTVLQTLSNGILITNNDDDDPAIFMIEGKFKNVIDGQAFSNKHYLLQNIGTFKYTNTSGSTSTVLKLKLIKIINTDSLE